MKKKLGILVAGGTGGHINSALAIGQKFISHDYDILYVSGKRTLDYNLFKGSNVLHVNAMPLIKSNIKKLFLSLWQNSIAFLVILRIFIKNRPSFALGAGGYVCGPTLLAAFIIGIPVFILEQNSVMGLTNRILLLFCKKIFLNFHSTVGISRFWIKKSIVTGNPVRSSLINFFDEDTKRQKQDELTFRILIFGGSLGSESINDLIWGYIKSKYDLPFRIHIKHQVGPNRKDWSGLENSEKKKLNEESQIQYEAVEYLHNIESDYAWSDLILCRSGASSISELRIIKRPVILIPYPFHRDRHQFINAERFKEKSNFPVYIETCEELEKDLYFKWKAILEMAYKEKVVRGTGKERNKKSKMEQEKTILKATENIYQEIKKYV